VARPRSAATADRGQDRSREQGTNGGLGPPMPFTPLEIGRRSLTEIAGTFAITIAAGGTDMAATLAPGEVDYVSRALVRGLVVTALIYALGDVSGAHFNPAVTLGFTLRRIFPVRWVPIYVVAQFVGAVLAALSLLAVLGDVRNLGASSPSIAAGPATAMEVLLTGFLIMVILGTADRKGLVGPNVALAVGAATVVCALFGLALSGASMNPARSIGPMLVTGRLGDAWIYLVGPLIGAVIAVVLAWAVHGSAPKDEEQVEAAEGE